MNFLEVIRKKYQLNTEINKCFLLGNKIFFKLGKQKNENFFKTKLYLESLNLKINIFYKC